MKNLILCSDGTGNAGGMLRGTNVWRVFQAIDRSAVAGQPDQYPFYDDGVGTEDLKLLRAIGGACGYGITRILVHLYGGLIRNFQPGDQIYLLGFSRGAFTARTLANILYYCGIASTDNLTPHQIHGRAREAIKAYKSRDACNPDQGAPRKFRDQYGRVDPNQPHGEKGRFPIRFVGVWDTVDAVGLPFDEMTDAFSWLFPLRFREKGNVRENDLHPLIENAYQALSIDDERHTFHPLMWMERVPYDPVTGETLKDAEKCLDFGKANQGRKQNVEQVWFAGAHANVGGGYPVDQVAYVALNWLLKHAVRCGLRLNADFLKEYARDADVHGKLYDSRAGLAAYYRYRPRDLKTICATGGIQQPTIHASAFERIQRHTEDYAPTGVPLAYRVADAPAGFVNEVNPAERLQRHGHVDDLIWQGRVLYFGFVAWTIALVGTALALRDEPAADVGGWMAGTRFLYALLRPLLDVAVWVTPSYFEPGVVAMRNHPLVFSGFLLTFVAIFAYSRRLHSLIQRHCNAGWKIAYATPAQVTALNQVLVPVPAGEPLLRRLRNSRWANVLANGFYRRFVPKAALLVSLAASAFLLWWWVYPAWNLAEADPVAENKLRDSASASVTFNTRNVMQPTAIVLEAGERYHITATVLGDAWTDGTLKADPDGLLAVPRELEVFKGTRRVKDAPWFKLMASIGPDEDEVIPIGWGREFVAKKSGRLYLFVNDAYGCYRNNHGEAEVKVERLAH